MDWLTAEIYCILLRTRTLTTLPSHTHGHSSSRGGGSMEGQERIGAMSSDEEEGAAAMEEGGEDDGE
jgi:hypothetical protein